MEIKIKPIGIIRTPFMDLKGMPIQPAGGLGIKGQIEVYEEYMEGLKDLEGFSHIILIYYFNHSLEFNLITKPFLENVEHGVFATRAPKRPNQIGISVVKLMEIKGNNLRIENIDILNDTPLLDIKPYVPDIDCIATDKIGWMSNKTYYFKTQLSDRRFLNSGK